jgi:hypothetical protein
METQGLLEQNKTPAAPLASSAYAKSIGCNFNDGSDEGSDKSCQEGVNDVISEGSLDGLSYWIDEGLECLDEDSKDGSPISVKIGLGQAFEDGFEDG